jgi:hypothetical protein
VAVADSAVKSAASGSPATTGDATASAVLVRSAFRQRQSAAAAGGFGQAPVGVARKSAPREFISPLHAKRRRSRRHPARCFVRRGHGGTKQIGAPRAFC